MNEQTKNTAAEAADLLPIEREGLRKDAILDEFRQVSNRRIKYLIGAATGDFKLKAELCLEAMTGDFTGFRVISEKGKNIVTARYAPTEDGYGLSGLEMADLSSGSLAPAVSRALLSDSRLRQDISDAIKCYELAAALYRA